MNKNTIRRNFIGAIILVMALLIFIPVITLVLLTREYDAQIRIETEHASTSIRQTVGAFMDGAYNLSYELAVNPVILTMDGEAQEPILIDCVGRNEYLELLFIQGMDGNQTARSSGELGYRGGRAWFLKVVEEQQPYVQESYYSIATGMPVTSVFIPMFRDSEMVGIFGADISLYYFQQLAEQFADEERGNFSFIIDGEGVVVAHPDVSLLETITNYKTQTRTVPLTDENGIGLLNPDGSVVTEEQEFELSDGFRYVIAEVMSGKHGLEIIESDGVTYYASYESIAMPGYSNAWAVITLQDREIAMSAIYDLMLRVIIIIAVILVIFIAAALAFFHSLSRTMDRLEAAKSEAEEANKSKSAFLSTMSHEIRTPMNAILGITEILLQRDDLHPEIKAALDRTYNSGNLLLNIINDILDLSKIEAGKLDLNIVKYEIASLLSDAAQLNMMRIGSKRIDFELKVDENLPAVLKGDELRVKQILNNLLSNAFKYTDEGKVVLSVTYGGCSRRWLNEGGKTVSPEGGDDALFSSLDNQYQDEITLIFTISDTGQGMNEEQLSKLFSEYTRFNMEANRRTEGTGLGLSITNKLVQMMDGDITVDSKPGKGSTFTVRIKQAKSGSNTLGREIAENLQRFRARGSNAAAKRLNIKREPMPYGNVLIVDDVETNIFVAKGLLSPYKLKIDTANSGPAAIRKIEEGNEYDIVFMDHMMPDMDGIEATKIIRKKGYKHPIVALTANAVAGQAEMFLSSGFNDFVSKPIDMRQMNQVLNKLIRDKQPPEVVAAARREHSAAAAAASSSQTSGGTAGSPADSGDGSSQGENPSGAIDPKIIEVFLRDANKAITILDGIIAKNGTYDTGDMRSFTINVHGLKSTLAVIGRQDMSDTARGLEAKGREENIAAVASEAPEFLRDLHTLIDELTKHSAQIGRSDSGEAEDSDADFLREKMRIIKSACDELDGNAIEEALAEMKQKTWSKATQDKLDTITEHLLHSDFDEIAHIAGSVE